MQKLFSTIERIGMRSRTAVSKSRPDALLAHDDRPDVGLGGRLDDRVDRVADQEPGALAL